MGGHCHGRATREPDSADGQLDAQAPERVPAWLRPQSDLPLSPGLSGSSMATCEADV